MGAEPTPPNPTRAADSAPTTPSAGPLEKAILPGTPYKADTPVGRYKQKIAERRQLKQAPYVKTLLWGLDDEETWNPPRAARKSHRPNAEWHEGRRYEKGDTSVKHGKLVYFARRPSVDELGQDGDHAKNHLPQPKKLNFLMLLMGTGLHYLVLFFYFGALSTYEGFSKGGRDLYISVEPPAGMPEWAPSGQKFIAARYAGRAYTRAYFQEAWEATAGIVFGFQIMMFFYHVSFSHHQKGRWARGLRALLMVDCFYEFLVCLKRRDMTLEYRTLRRLEMVCRGLPLAVYMASVILRFHPHYTEAERNALLFAVYMSIFSAVITTVDNLGAMKPSCFISIALKSYGWIARIFAITYCLTSAMIRVCVFATYAVALETKVFESLAWILCFRGFFYACWDLLDTFGMFDVERLQELFRKIPVVDIKPKEERDEQAIIWLRGPALFLQSWIFGYLWSLQSLFIDMPLVDMKAGKYYNNFVPVFAQVMLTTTETWAAFDAACPGSQHPLPWTFGCGCMESKRDRSADLQCTPDHTSPKNQGILRGQISILYGFHIMSLLVMALLARHKIKKGKLQIDPIDQEDVDIEEATVYPEPPPPPSKKRREAREAQDEESGELVTVDGSENSGSDYDDSDYGSGSEGSGSGGSESET